MVRRTLPAQTKGTTTMSTTAQPNKRDSEVARMMCNQNALVESGRAIHTLASYRAEIEAAAELRGRVGREAEIVAWLRAMQAACDEPNSEWCAAQRLAFKVSADAIKNGEIDRGE
jgi:hypothetical protein